MLTLIHILCWKKGMAERSWHMNTRRWWTEATLFSHHFESCFDFWDTRSLHRIKSIQSCSVHLQCGQARITLLSLSFCVVNLFSLNLPSSAKPATLVCTWLILSLHFCLVPEPEPHLSLSQLLKYYEPSKRPALCTPCVVYHKRKVDETSFSFWNTSICTYESSSKRGASSSLWRSIIDMPSSAFCHGFSALGVGGWEDCSMETQHPVFCCFNYKGKRHWNHTTAPKRLVFCVQMWDRGFAWFQ